MIKRILILYKQSTYKHFFLSRGHKNPFKDEPIAKRFMRTHEEHFLTLAKVEKFLKAQSIAYDKILRGRKPDFSKYDFIITVGGDGTFLEAASHVTAQPVLGINSDPAWSVGRFCSANSRNFDTIILNILKGKRQWRALNRMKVSFHDSKIDVLSLNDILVCHKNPGAMSRYYLDFRGQKEEQRSSGIWVATAAGSTGAIRSAGGKVMPEESSDLQFVARELYCGKTTGRTIHRKAIFSPKEHLRITSLMKDGVVYVDGSHVCVPFTFGEMITIKKSNYPLKLVVA